MIITLNTPVKTSLFAGKSLVSSLKRHLFSWAIENIAKINLRQRFRSNSFTDVAKPLKTFVKIITKSSQQRS
ncbi:hypothetical protein TUM12370_33890 [Salmonella enterica subsp. enterica serovar Choleraesuis]|nr:hypothetical protein TUM12370_33890 [Salmonella enterica subsp. enterica serovar Choleraesuis]